MSSPDTKLQSLFPGNEIHSPPTPRYSLHLISYFRSGWAFFIPYLVAYLLYAWLKWPVNPATDGSLSPSVLRLPSLLHVYWLLHVIHVPFAIAALRFWSHEARSFRPRSLAPWSLAPWLGLGLIFWIPGIYLEWPSDPWEHLRRINEWHILGEVTAHSSWKKSSYFLPYSLTGHSTGLDQLSLLNFYYTGVCLLLSWQYYRLARAVGLGERAATLFVIFQALLMGNSVFSFYRYYGLSSSILAQLGAIALTRAVLEVLGASKMAPQATGHRPGLPPGADQALPHSLLVTRFSLLRLAGAIVLLIPLIAFNHIQGIGIAGLGILAVIVWRLIEWRRSMIGWLALAAVLASVVTVLWFPRHPALDEIFRQQGWLTSWYGFNLFSLASPALERCLHILGAIGALSLIFGLWLIVRRNHIAGWLTLMPIIALVLPCFALPFAHVLATHTTPENIVTFHRFLFAAPLGLTLVVMHSEVRGMPAPASPSLPSLALSMPAVRLVNWPKGYSLFCVGLISLLTLSAGSTAYNRIWHCLQVTPDDLALGHFTSMWTPENRALVKEPDTLTIIHPLCVKVQETFSPTMDWRQRRQLHKPPALNELRQQLEWLSALSFSRWKLSNVGTNQNWQVFSRSSQDDSSTPLWIDFTANDAPWLRFARSEAKFTFDEGRLNISNPQGAASHVFSPELIRIQRNKRYYLTSSLRQSGDPATASYLAVAWYDREGRLLYSHQPQPEGAGRPAGWSNGTYSYYGLINQPASAEWTRHSIAFGLGEQAAIPANAAFIRVGALLNYRSTPEAVAELNAVLLEEKPLFESILMARSKFGDVYSPASQAAFLSRHWSPHKVSAEHVGIVDLAQRISEVNDSLD